MYISNIYVEILACIQRFAVLSPPIIHNLLSVLQSDMSPLWRRIKSIPHTTWIAEIAALALSMSAMAAIVAVLVVYDGQDIQHWNFPDNVSINAVIATLNTVSRTLLMFALSSAVGQWRWITVNRSTQPLSRFVDIDRLSQGPLGSVQFLWRTLGR